MPLQIDTRKPHLQAEMVGVTQHVGNLQQYLCCVLKSQGPCLVVVDMCWGWPRGRQILEGADCNRLLRGSAKTEVKLRNSL